MKLPLRYEFETEADSDLNEASRNMRREAKVFLEAMESSSLMGNVDPDQLAMIATNAMNLAAEKFSGHSDGKKKEAAQHLFFVLSRLREFEVRMAELRSEIKNLESEINDLESDYEELNSELQTVNRLLDPSKGGEGEYDRAQALHLLRLPSGSEMANTDIQALLWERKVAVTEEMTVVEAQLDHARNRLNVADSELAELTQEAATLRVNLDQATTLENIPSIPDGAEPTESVSSRFDEETYDRNDGVVVETSAPNAIGGF